MPKPDDELVVMGRIDRMLQKLPAGARARVLAWLLAKNGAQGKVSVDTDPEPQAGADATPLPLCSHPKL
jgi:hypothetical protein